MFALFFSAPVVALAWGLLGHRIVGEIATSYLTPKAKAEIQRILGNESLAMASNWADFIKSDSTFDSLNSWHYINLDKDLSRSEVLSFLEEDTATAPTEELVICPSVTGFQFNPPSIVFHKPPPTAPK